MLEIFFLVNFQCQDHRHQSLNCHCSVLLNQTPLPLDKEGIKEREDWERNGGRLLKGGDCLIIAEIC